MIHLTDTIVLKYHNIVMHACNVPVQFGKEEDNNQGTFRLELFERKFALEMILYHYEERGKNKYHSISFYFLHCFPLYNSIKTQ